MKHSNALFSVRRRGARVWGTLLTLSVIVTAFLPLPVLQASTAPEIPTHLTYFLPTYFPKNHQTDFNSSGMTPGQFRNEAETIYEQFWRETSYYRADPQTGLAERGVYVRSKTAGEIAVPWAFSPGFLGEGGITNVTGEVLGTASGDVDTLYEGRLESLPLNNYPVIIQVGARTLSDTTGSGLLRGDGRGTINYSTGAYSFRLVLNAAEGASVTASYFVDVSEEAPSPQQWANFSGPVGDSGASRHPDGRGEHFMEEAFGGVTAVMHPRWNPELNEFEDEPLIDGFWTPGERYTDRARGGGTQPPTGYWNPYENAEDRWTPSYDLPPLSEEILARLDLLNYMQGTTRGDFFYDYNFSVREVNPQSSDGYPAGRVTRFHAPIVSTSVDLWIADRSLELNRPITLNEFDLTPPVYAQGQSVFSDDYFHAEDKWEPVRQLSPVANAAMPAGLVNFLNDAERVGSVFADYNRSVARPGDPEDSLTSLNINSNLTIYVANWDTGTNVAYHIHEMNLTPPVYFFDDAGTPAPNYRLTLNDPLNRVPGDGEVLDGDASWTYIRDMEPDNPYPEFSDIGHLGRFEYQFVRNRPQVFISTNHTLLVTTYLPPSLTAQITNSASGVVGNYRYDPDHAYGRRIVLDDPTEGFNLSNPALSGFDLPPGDRVPLHVEIPIYYGVPIWGEPFNTNTFDQVAADAGILNAFVDAVGNDDEWTPADSEQTLVTGPSEQFFFDGTRLPDPYVPHPEGDAAWTYVRDETVPNFRPMYGSITNLNRIEYNADAAGNVHIYQAPRQYWVTISTFLDLPDALYDDLLSNPEQPISGLMYSNAIVHVINPEPGFFTSGFVAKTFEVRDDFQRIEAAVPVPLYYSYQIWGRPDSPATFESPFGGAIGTANVFRDAIGNDDRWTAALPADPFDDFISWWDPTGGPDGTGVWVPGLIDTPNSGILPAGAEPTPDFWTYEDYTDYIRNNYPGDAEGLIARTDNGRYDGPERWAEVDNNQMIQRGYVLGMETELDWYFDVDPSVSSYDDWWQNRYGSDPALTVLIPDIVEWNPALEETHWAWEEQAFAGTVTNFAPDGVTVESVETRYQNVTIPPRGSTWTYDAPRQFDDLPSSLYHNPDLGSLSAISMRDLTYKDEVDVNPAATAYGGDMRLGEVTSPWSDSIYGEDIGDNDPRTANLDGDGIIPLGGPYAINPYGNFGLDAVNVLSLEYITHRRDGASLTGPRGGSQMPLGYTYMAASYDNWLEDSVRYARDHRDTNLNGLIDQGETIPAGSHNYFVDADPDTTDDGMNTMPLFGWERLMETIIAIRDIVDDFPSMQRFEIPGLTGAGDVPIAAPSGFGWEQGLSATDLLINAPNVLGAILYADIRGTGDYTPGIDPVWIDANNSGVYNSIRSEEILHGSGSPTDVFTGTHVDANWADLNGSGSFEAGEDIVWLDDASNTVIGEFTTDRVLRDSGGLLQPGSTGGLRTRDPVLGIERSIYIYPADPDAFSLMWAVTNDYAGATEVFFGGSTNGVDLIYREPGFELDTSGAYVGERWDSAANGDVRYFTRVGVDTGVYMQGDDVFIDADRNGEYTADTVLVFPNSGLTRSHAGVAATGTVSVSYTTFDGRFRRRGSVTWKARNIPLDERSGELVLTRGIPISPGVPGIDISSQVQWIDLPLTDGTPPDGMFTPLMPDGTGTDLIGERLTGDAVFIDRSMTGVFNYGDSVQVPLYLLPIFGDDGLAAASPLQAGQFYGSMTRSGYIGGFMQAHPVSAWPGLTMHEQAHDIFAYPDLYDYDTYDENGFENHPVGSGDLMAGSTLVHGYPDLKFRLNPAGDSWPSFRGVVPQELNFGAPGTTILEPNGGLVTLELKPVERHADQYYVFRNTAKPEEFFTIWYNAGPSASPYANPLGQGVGITHSDYSKAHVQQRANHAFVWRYIQADGNYELADGETATVGPQHAFGTSPETSVFTSHSSPKAVWYNDKDSGLQIVDIRLPDDPLQPAEIDIMWTPADPNAPGFGEPYWIREGLDSSGNGIPDAWEWYWFGRYADPLSIVGPDTDYSGDGITDYEAWRLRLNPTIQQPDSIWSRDSDSDGITDIDEVRYWGTDPFLPDTADNALLDGDLADGQPATSLIPAVDRVLSLDGAVDSYVQMPNQSRFSLSSFTLQAWVKPVSHGGDILTRQVSPGVHGYRLHIDSTGRAVFEFTPSDLTANVIIMAPASTALPLDDWTHVAATFDGDTGSMRLYVNGEQRASLITVKRPAMSHGSGAWTRIGSSFEGMIDEVAIHDIAAPASVIQSMKNGVVLDGNDPLVSYYSFDDSTSAEWDGTPGGYHYGTSGNPDWYWGQVEDFAVQVNMQEEVEVVVDEEGELISVTNLVAVTERSYDRDWLYAWRNSGTLVGNVAMVDAPEGAPVQLSMRDSNKDGIPDWWYMLYGFDPRGESIAHEDPDMDGLSNYQEFLAGTDPFNPDTLNTGFGDYDSRPSAFEPTFGELYDDGDRIADWWEVQFMGRVPGTMNRGLDPDYYDAHLDPDEDGWSNYAEFMADTDPTDPLSYPVPNVQFNLRYQGRYGSVNQVFAQREYVEEVANAPSSPPTFTHTLQSDRVIPGTFRLRFEAGGSTHVIQDNANPGDNALTGGGIGAATINYEAGTVSINFTEEATDLEFRYIAESDLEVRLSFYSQPSMDGHPNARTIVRSPAETVGEMDIGHLVEGRNYVFAFMDVNGDGVWDPVNEPAGVASFDLSWGDWTEVEIAFTDDRQVRGFPRVSWEPVDAEDQAFVPGYTIEVMQGRDTLLTRFIEGPRTYMHEGDFLYAGLDGLGGSGSEEAYTIQVYRNNTVFGLDFSTPHELAIAIVTNQVTEAPTFVTGHDFTYVYARNDVEWRMDPDATWYRFEFREDAGDAPGADIMETERMTRPHRNAAGVYRAAMPFYAGDRRPDGGVWENGRYWMRVTTGMQEGGVQQSEWRAFNLQLREPQTSGGKNMIDGKLYYFGGHDYFSDMPREDGAVSNNMPVVVQAFTNPGFSGVPYGQVTIDPSAWTNTEYRFEAPFALKGLPPGTYYLRAFIDSTRDGRLHYWESWGYGRDTQTYYEPVEISMPNAGAVRVSDKMIIIRDRDTDGDGLPDIWEYHHYEVVEGIVGMQADGMIDHSDFLDLIGGKDVGPGDITMRARWQYGLDSTTEVAFVDQNANNIPDWWEEYYFGRLLDPGEHLEDWDGDGMSIYDEYRAGTDPTNPYDRLSITGTMIAGGGNMVTWSGRRNYRVLYSVSLMDDWEIDDDLGKYTRVPIGGDVYEWTYVDTDVSPGESRFYKVVIVPDAEPLP